MIGASRGSDLRAGENSPLNEDESSENAAPEDEDGENSPLSAVATLAADEKLRMSIEERREAVRELAAEGMSQRAIGGVLGVDHRTVGHDLKDGENSPPGEDEASENAVPEGEAGENSPLSLTATLAADEKLRKG